MFNPPIDNWTQADEDCYDCKHRLDLGDRIAHLEARVQAADALAKAVKFYLSPAAVQPGASETQQMRDILKALAAYRATGVADA